MHEETKLDISRLVDGDLGHDETLSLLGKIQSDDMLKHQMSRYQAISQALKTDAYHQVSCDFSRKVFQEIQQEPAYFLPQLKPAAKSQTQPQDKYSKRKLFAVAASTVAAAVLVGQGLREDQSGNKYATVTAMAVPQQSFPVTQVPHENPAQRSRQPFNAQFNDYLQAHNSSVYTNGEAVFQPYARVTSYGRD
jgi:sigma-E factor negative regulatory protein RseA